MMRARFALRMTALAIGVGSLGASSLVAAADSTAPPPWDVVPTQDRESGGSVLTGVTALSPGDAWAVGPGWGYFPRTTLTEHWDGTSWTIVPSPEPADSTSAWLSEADGVSSDDVWAVGASENGSGATEPLIEHWDGTAWSIVASPQGTTGQLRDVEAISETDAWAVGKSGSGSIILRWNGTRWSATANPCSFNLHAVRAVSANDIWAVGYQHTCHWDGRAWSEVIVNPYSRTTFVDVAGASSDSVWAVSSTTVCPYDCSSYRSIWRWDGATWTRERTTDDYLSGIEVVPSGRVYLVGAESGMNGTLVLFRDGFQWRRAPNPDVAGSLSAVSASPAGDLWAVGRTVDAGPPRPLAERAPALESGGAVGNTDRSGVTVSWFGPESGSIDADETGDYAVGGLAPGDYTLIATRSGCDPASAPVTVSAGNTVSQDLPVVC